MQVLTVRALCVGCFAARDRRIEGRRWAMPTGKVACLLSQGFEDSEHITIGKRPEVQPRRISLSAKEQEKARRDARLRERARASLAAAANRDSNQRVESHLRWSEGDP